MTSELLQPCDAAEGGQFRRFSEDTRDHTSVRQKWCFLAVVIFSIVTSWAPWGYANLMLVENGQSRNDLAYFIVFPLLYLGLMVVWVIMACKAPCVFPPLQIQWFGERKGRSLLSGIPLSFAVITACLALRYLSDGLGLPRTAKVVVFSRCWSTAFTIIYLTRIVILGPFVEEVFWRGYIQTSLQRVIGRPAGLLLQAVAFALVHLYTLADTALVFLVGLIYGFWRDRKKTLVPIIIAHIIFNSFGIIRFLEQRRGIARTGNPGTVTNYLIDAGRCEGGEWENWGQTQSCSAQELL